MAVPIIIPGEVVEISTYCMQRSQLAINRLHYVCTSVLGVGGGIDQAAAAVGASLGPQYLLLMTAQATFRGTGARRIFPLAFKSKEYFSSAGVGVGGVAGNSLPMQTCGLIKKVTDVPGRKGVGHAYVPFPGVADDTLTGTPTGGYLARLLPLAIAMQSAIVAGGGGNQSTLVPILFNRATLSSTPISQHQALSSWATQRRRSDFGRQNISPV